MPHSTVPDGSWWLAALGLLVLMVLAGAVASSGPSEHWLHTLAPLLLIPAVQALRAADGNALSGFAYMLLLPTIWFALYGRLREVALSILGGSLVVILPLILIGAPRYPAVGWRGAALLIIVLATVGPLVHNLVATAREQTMTAELSSARFRAVFDDAPVGMALTPEHVRADSSFFLVNTALCAMLGRDHAELMSLPLRAICEHDDLPTLLIDAADTERSAQFEVRLRHRSGRTVWAAISRARLTDLRGQSPQIAWQVQDITGRAETDNALLDALDLERAATERLRNADRARTELVSSISHDLRTPLTAALGYAEMLADGDMGALSAQQSATAATIARSLTKLSTIVGELVNLPVGSDERAVSVQPVDLHLVLEDSLHMVAIQSALRDQQLTVTNNLQSARVEGDPVLLERALVNLLSNAVKYTPVHGSVAVAAHADASHAIISISDTGEGISADDQLRIFDRFYRAPRDEHHPVNGTGLGLAIVKAITTQHGGTITVRSDPGQGSVFVLRLPLQ